MTTTNLFYRCAVVDETTIRETTTVTTSTMERSPRGGDQLSSMFKIQGKTRQMVYSRGEKSGADFLGKHDSTARTSTGSDFSPMWLPWTAFPRSNLPQLAPLLALPTTRSAQSV